MGGLILTGIDEKLISQNRSLKVRDFWGATTADMYDNIKPMIKRNLDYILLYNGTSDRTHQMKY